MPRRPKARHLYLRNGIWVARIAGKRRSTGCTDLDAAKLWLKREELRSQQAASGLSPEAASHTVASALDWWMANRCVDRKPKTFAMYDYAARCLREVLGPIAVNALTREDVQDYYQQRLDDGIARSTVLKERITLLAALKVASERGLLLKAVDAVVPPFRFKYVPRRIFLRIEDFPRLLATLEPHRQLWVRVVVFSGAGHQEVEALQWSDDMGSTLRVPGTKVATRDRLVPIGAQLRAVLDSVPREQRSGPIVERWCNVNRDLRRACARAGIEPRVTAHDLRRTFGSWLAQAGASTKSIGELLGHAPGSRMADLTYSVLTDASLRATIDLLEPPKRKETKR